MKLAVPLSILMFRGLSGLVLFGLVAHLLGGATIFVVPYQLAGWMIVGLLLLMLYLSWVRKPISVYIIAGFIPLLPAAFLSGLWFIVLKSAPVWEFVVIGGSFMLLPITLSVQIIRSRATREYFRLPLKTEGVDPESSR